MVAKSILIVEDDITYGMMLKTWLGKKGFRVASASSIQRAKAHLEAEGADLILSDLRLPDRDGTYLLEWLRGRGLSIPLIIMTGYADIQSAVKATRRIAEEDSGGLECPGGQNIAAGSRRERRWLVQRKCACL